ncbi:HAD family hydrolase [Congregibacter sp.]|uniref:HAD family hydrolase n=1 Tax=Congregibacter sp. TaxID=2744308 RepID=UPI003F6D5651
MNPRLKALIFDLDGTLVDSRLDFAAMRREIGAPAGIGLLEYVETLRCEDAQQSAMDVIHKHEVAGAMAATWIPTAEEALHSLHEQGIPIAIVTRNNRHAAKLTMDRLSMPSIPLKAREDAAPKPDPEALLAIAKEWRIHPAHCAYIGDFRYDIEAAQRAGMLPVLYHPAGESPPAFDTPPRALSDFRVLTEWCAGQSSQLGES